MAAQMVVSSQWRPDQHRSAVGGGLPARWFGDDQFRGETPIHERWTSRDAVPVEPGRAAEVGDGWQCHGGRYATRFGDTGADRSASTAEPSPNSTYGRVQPARTRSPSRQRRSAVTTGEPRPIKLCHGCVDRCAAPVDPTRSASFGACSSSIFSRVLRSLLAPAMPGVWRLAGCDGRLCHCAARPSVATSRFAETGRVSPRERSASRRHQQ